MAVISMKDHDPSKPTQKKWVAKATIYKVIELKDKQIDTANKTTKALQEELERHKALLIITDREMRYQTHLKTVYQIATILLIMVLIWSRIKIHG